MEHNSKYYGYGIIALGIIGIILHKFMLETFDKYFLAMMIAIIGLWLISDFIKREIVPGEAIVRSLMIFVGIVLYFFNLHLEGMLLLTMFGFAEILEGIIERYAEKRLEKLLELIPKKVKIIENGNVIVKSIDSVKTGEIVVVGKGERIAVDGVIVDGEALIDESAITGEPEPRSVKAYDKILAGGLILAGTLRIKALRSGRDSLITRIVSLVKKFKKRKASIETIVNKFSKFYLAIMLVLAAIVWLALGYYKALILIAIGCPSAFLVSIPATLLASISVYAKRGILVKGTKPIETASKVKVVALDKTGTITLGTLVLEKIITVDSFEEADVLAYTASLEIYSTHPVAKAIINEAKKRNIKLFTPTNVIEKSAEGIYGIINGEKIFVGKINPENIPDHIIPLIEEYEGKVLIQLSVNGKLKAVLVFGDKLNPDSKRIIDELRKLKIHVVMLTGDRKVSAERVAEELGIKEFYAELKPEDKVRIINDFKRKYKSTIAMIGDGINDAPALAASDLGIAVGGLEIAGEAGDIVITHEGIKFLPYILKFAKISVRKVFENIGIILTAKSLAAFLGVIGFIPLWAAVALGDDGGALFSLINIVYLFSKHIKR